MGGNETYMDRRTGAEKLVSLVWDSGRGFVRKRGLYRPLEGQGRLRGR